MRPRTHTDLPHGMALAPEEYDKLTRRLFRTSLHSTFLFERWVAKALGMDEVGAVNEGFRVS
jgi:hypothetical protein